MQNLTSTKFQEGADEVEYLFDSPSCPCRKWVIIPEYQKTLKIKMLNHSLDLNLSPKYALHDNKHEMALEGNEFLINSLFLSLSWTYARSSKQGYILRTRNWNHEYLSFTLRMRQLSEDRDFTCSTDASMVINWFLVYLFCVIVMP